MHHNKGVLIVGAVALSTLAIGGVLMSQQKSAQTGQEKAQTDTQVTQDLLTQKPAEKKKSMKNGAHTITLETSKGAITFETFDADAPKAVANFIKLSKEGFYDKLIFHRVIKGFMIQGGDPNGNGTSGPGYSFQDELDPATESYKRGYKKGVVAMANSGPNTNGSQFFIMLEDYPLPNNYTIFGRVTKGQDVVDSIGKTETDAGDKPKTPITIKKATVADMSAGGTE